MSGPALIADGRRPLASASCHLFTCSPAHLLYCAPAGRNRGDWRQFEPFAGEWIQVFLLSKPAISPEIILAITSS